MRELLASHKDLAARVEKLEASQGPLRAEEFSETTPCKRRVRQALVSVRPNFFWPKRVN
jgi:hypothetical protein